MARALQAMADAQRAHAEALEIAAEAFLATATLEPGPATGPGLSALVDVKGAAVLLDMSVDWVYRALAEGRIPKVKMGSKVKIRRADLDAFIETRCVAVEPRDLAKEARQGPSLSPANGYDEGSQVPEEEQEVPNK